MSSPSLATKARGERISMPTARRWARTWSSLVTSGVAAAALNATNFRSSRSAIMTKASGSTGSVNSPSGRNRSATPAQSRPGIRRRIVSVSRRVGLFQTSRKCLSRTAARTRAAALELLKPAATNYVGIDHNPVHADPVRRTIYVGDLVKFRFRHRKGCVLTPRG